MSIDLKEVVGPDAATLARKSDMPEWVSPMLATLTRDRFSDPNWIFERKFDGERVLVVRRGSRVRLMSRNRRDISQTYPELATELGSQADDDFIADGEVVAFQGDVTSFSRLQDRMQLGDPARAEESGVTVYLYLFDMLHIGGLDITRLPLRARKRVLERAVRFEGHIRYSRHRNEKGEEFYEEACSQGWEGLIAKKADSPYRHSRSSDWLKFKCVHQQELVIGGFTEPEGSRIGFGALLIGYYEGGHLRYAGKVGTGFNNETLKRLYSHMRSRESDAKPFMGADELDQSSVHWVKPELVCEIRFTEWTREGKLRHPSFMGLRRDKSPREVTRES